jgi:hypothetical protein
MEPRTTGGQEDKQQEDEGGMSTTTEQPPGTEPRSEIVRRRLSTAEILALDPYQLMAELGKTVIHPGGGRSTRELLDMAGLQAGSAGPRRRLRDRHDRCADRAPVSL